MSRTIPQKFVSSSLKLLPRPNFGSARRALQGRLLWNNTGQDWKSDLPLHFWTRNFERHWPPNFRAEIQWTNRFGPNFMKISGKFVWTESFPRKFFQSFPLHSGIWSSGWLVPTLFHADFGKEFPSRTLLEGIDPGTAPLQGCAVPFALQNRALFRGTKMASTCEKCIAFWEEEGWPGKGAKRKKGLWKPPADLKISMQLLGQFRQGYPGRYQGRANHEVQTVNWNNGILEVKSA